MWDKIKAFFRRYQPVQLGEILVTLGWVTESELARLLEQQRKTGTPVGQLAVQAGHMLPADVHALVELQALINSDRRNKDFLLFGQAAEQYSKQLTRMDRCLAVQERTVCP